MKTFVGEEFPECEKSIVVSVGNYATKKFLWVTKNLGKPWKSSPLQDFIVCIVYSTIWLFVVMVA